MRFDAFEKETGMTTIETLIWCFNIAFVGWAITAFYANMRELARLQKMIAFVDIRIEKLTNRADEARTAVAKTGFVVGDLIVVWYYTNPTNYYRGTFQGIETRSGESMLIVKIGKHDARWGEQEFRFKPTHVCCEHAAEFDERTRWQHVPQEAKPL